MGGAMNTMGAIGGPMASLGTMAIGMDPMSAAMRGFGSGGLAGGVMGGLGSAGFGMMASYGAGQMFTGAQQQQALNSSMRQNFGFRNQFGGSGFTGSDTSQIGGTMRQMAMQQGPGGEMVGFEELGRLASNMGRMGMAQGVRDAKDFSDKFREMIKTVKEIASSMGSSLEEAQKMMVGMRGAGIFKNADASKFASMIRAGASAGGLSQPELTSMMSIGSQISRSMGGRGIAGAKAGIETLTNIGVAQQMGFISEESIYNATGLTGVEGRQAMATQQLQTAASFIRTNKGRYAMAAMADKNGNLSKSDVEAFMYGGQSVEETRSRANHNLAGVGRANFIRNEGRLRGEMLGKFGGLAPAVMMRGWMQGKGIDIDSMGDREMLFFQRQTGMGRDEADNMVQMMRNLPQLMRQRNISAQDDDFSKRMNLRQQHTGIEGIKHKLEAAKASVQNNLQQAGADFYSEGANVIDRYINKLTGTYVQEYNSKVTEAFAASRLGGAEGRQALRSTFGVGGGKSLIGLPGQGGGGLSNSQFAKEFSRVDAGRFSDAGYGLDNATAKGAQQMMRLGSSVSSAMAGPGSDVGVSSRLASALRAGYSGVTGLGMDRLKNVEAMINDVAKSDQGAASIAKQLAGASPEEKARIIAGVNKSIGRADEAKMYAVPDMMGVYGTNKYNTITDEHRAIGEALITSKGRDAAQSGWNSWGARAGAGIIAGAVGGLAGMFSLGAGAALGVGTYAGLRGIQMHMTDSKISEAAGAFLEGKTGSDLINRLATGDSSAMGDINKQMAVLEQRRDSAHGQLSPTDVGAMESLRAMRAATELMKLGPKPSKAQLEALAKQQGYESAEKLQIAANMIGGHVTSQWTKNQLQLANTEGKAALGRMDSVSRSGLVSRGKDGNYSVQSGALSALGINGTAAHAYLSAMAGADSETAGMVGGDVSSISKHIAGGQMQIDASRSSLAHMSVSDKRALASKLSGVEGVEGWREDLLASGDMQSRLQNASRRKGGGVGGIGAMLGSSMGQKDIQALMKRGASNDEIARALASSAGVGADQLSSGSGFLKDLSSAVGGVKSGDVGGAAEKLRAVLGGSTMEGVRKANSEANADPIQKDMRDSLLSIKQSMVASTSSLASIVGNTAKKAEDT